MREKVPRLPQLWARFESVLSLRDTGFQTAYSCVANHTRKSRIAIGYLLLFVTQHGVDPMLAEIFMLRLEANTRPPQGEPISVGARFVAFKPEIRFELKKRSSK